MNTKKYYLEEARKGLAEITSRLRTESIKFKSPIIERNAEESKFTKESKKIIKSALDVQVSGNHYSQGSIQPIEYIHANDLGFMEGSIIKYITRHKFKNGKEDLLKIKHYVDLLIELEYGE